MSYESQAAHLVADLEPRTFKHFRECYEWTFNAVKAGTLDLTAEAKVERVELLAREVWKIQRGKAP